MQRRAALSVWVQINGGVVRGSSNTGYPADYPVLTTSYINHSFLSLVKKKKRREGNDLQSR